MDETKHVRFCRKISPKKVRIEIIDEGPGFDADDLPNPTVPTISRGLAGAASC